jgi:hypothetical protein
VFADFSTSRARPGGPDEVALGSEAPLRREWAVICDGPGAAACLAGWELPSSAAPTAGGPAPLRARHFEALWTTDPTAVRGALDLAVALARASGGGLPAVEEAARSAADEPPAPIDPALPQALARRIVTRLVRPQPAPRGRPPLSGRRAAPGRGTP